MIRKLTLFILLPPLAILSQQLDIPEITVYGERQIQVEPVEKGVLPFEEEPIPPIYRRKSATLPSIKEEREIKNERNIGLQSRAEGGNKYEGYLIGYLRKYYYPLEFGISGLKNSNIEEDYINVFSRTSFYNLYFDGAYLYRRNSNKISYLTVSGYFPNISGNVTLAYSDSLIANANVDLFILPFDFEIDIFDDLQYHLKATYNKYPFRVGLSFYEMRIYPEFLYFLPLEKSLYIKGSLVERDVISRILTGFPQFRWECNSFNPYYRAEIGRGETPGVSLFYSSETLTDTLGYIGVSGIYKGIQLEFGYPIKEGSAYFRAGVGLRIRDLIDVNLYGYLHDKNHYFLSTDIGFLLIKNLKLGASGTIINGWKDDFDLTGYLSIWI